MISLQEPSGSFRASVDANESDTRFLYCACAISTILNDWSGVDIPRAVDYILSCVTYEGAISLHPGSLVYFLLTNIIIKNLICRARRPWRFYILRRGSTGAHGSVRIIE